MEYFVTGYSMEKLHMILLPDSDWKTVNVTLYICLSYD